MSGAGTILREDINEPNQLVISHSTSVQRTFERKGRKNLQAIFEKNIHYISELAALRVWYLHIRSLFAQDLYGVACVEGADRLLNRAMHERQHRLNQLLAQSVDHLASSDHEKRYEQALRVDLNDHRYDLCTPPAELCAYFADHNVYLQAMHNLPELLKQTGQTWLRNVAASVSQLWDQ